MWVNRPCVCFVLVLTKHGAGGSDLFSSWVQVCVKVSKHLLEAVLLNKRCLTSNTNNHLDKGSFEVSLVFCLLKTSLNS